MPLARGLIEPVPPLFLLEWRNLHRRHLTESQRAMVAAKMADLKSGGDRKSDDFKFPIGSLKTQAQVGELLNVGHGSIGRARQVVTKAIPEIQDMVTSGEVSVNAAHKVAAMTEDDQRKPVPYRGGGFFGST